jgi:hypothetical protein
MAAVLSANARWTNLIKATVVSEGKKAEALMIFMCEQIYILKYYRKVKH